VLIETEPAGCCHTDAEQRNDRRFGVKIAAETLGPASAIDLLSPAGKYAARRSQQNIKTDRPTLTLI